MRRLVVMLAIVLLMFTGTGVHKTFAATPDMAPHSAAGLLAQLPVAAAAVVQQQEAQQTGTCCAKALADGTPVFASCAVPPAMLTSTALHFASTRALRIAPRISTLIDGLPSDHIKRPPKPRLV